MSRHNHVPSSDDLRVLDYLCLRSGSAAATEKLGQRLGQYLPPDCVISLDGDLGAGKTTFVRGLAAGIGSQDPVSSPTFTLLIEHKLTTRNIPLYHFDVYRLAVGDDSGLAAEQFLAAGLDEYFDAGGISVVEWGQLIEDLLPKRTLHIRLTMSVDASPDERQIKLIGSGQTLWPDELGPALQALINQGWLSLTTEDVLNGAGGTKQEGETLC